jgi:hypothetical protein
MPFLFKLKGFFPPWCWYSRVWLQGLTVARQVHYQLNHAPSSFFALVIFQVKPRAFEGANIRLQSSHLTLYYHAWLPGWDGVSLTFMDWPWTSVLQISTSLGAVTIGMSH